MIGRELVYSRRYDANRVTVGRNGLYIDMVLGKKLSKKVLGFGVFGHTFFRAKILFSENYSYIGFFGFFHAEGLKLIL